MITALDKATFLMGLRDQPARLININLFEANKLYHALEIAESFYMELSELGYDSVGEAMAKAQSSNSNDIPGAQSFVLNRIQDLLNDWKTGNPIIAALIQSDLALIEVHNFISPLNFLCKVRSASSTIPKTKQGANYSFSKN